MLSVYAYTSDIYTGVYFESNYRALQLTLSLFFVFLIFFEQKSFEVSFNFTIIKSNTILKSNLKAQYNLKNHVCYMMLW